MSKIDIDFITSDDGVLVLGFADEFGPWVIPYDPAHRPAAAVPLVHYHDAPGPFNVSARRVGGLMFIKVGCFCLSFCITRTYRSL